MEQPLESRQEKFGRLAFAYCKIATVSLILGRFALPVSAALAGGLFLAGVYLGKKDTKCFLKNPLIAGLFWMMIMAFWMLIEFAPNSMPIYLKWLHR